MVCWSGSLGCCRLGSYKTSQLQWIAFSHKYSFGLLQYVAELLMRARVKAYIFIAGEQVLLC